MPKTSSPDVKVELQWLPPGEDPPPSRFGRSSRYQGIVEQLKERPGQWALLGGAPVSAGKGLRRYGIEVTARNGNGNGKGAKLYARWAG